MKVRAVLDYKNISYERRNALGKPIFEIRRRGRIGKVPALELDGEFICDSTDIAHALEKRFPEPPILPSSPRERGLCHALEDWADEALYFIGLYYQWIEPQGRKMVPQAFGKRLMGRAAVLYFERVIKRQVLGHGTARKPPEHILSDLRRNLESIEAMLDGQKFLLGSRPYLCDFAVASMLHYLRRTPVGGQEIESHKAIVDYLERMKALRADKRAVG